MSIVKRIVPIALMIIPICACSLVTTHTTARAQDVATTISKAQTTLSEIDALIAGIQARHGSPGGQVGDSGWKNLFDGQSLAGWVRADVGGSGDVTVDKAFRGGVPAIVVGMGDSLSGFKCTGGVPKTRYEISLEAMKIEGNDFMCGLTFPVGDSHASLILGGWGGSVVGISSIDNLDASENETTKFISFPKDRWYKVRVRVTPEKLQAWLDDKQIVDQVITGRKVGLRPGSIINYIPLGISTYRTSAAFREIKIRRLETQ